MTFSLTPELRSAIEAHAREQYPNESCGVVIKGVYRPCENVAPDPLNDFEIGEHQVYLADGLEAIVHSHPGGPDHPTHSDMESQIATAVPWVILPLNEDQFGEPILWGEGVEIPPIIGREFKHGVTDCYSLIRDVYRLGKDKLAEQGISWPFEPIELPEFPRDDAWWNLDQNLYIDNFEKAGFVRVKREEVQPGDIFMCKIRSKVENHAGVLIDDGLVLHHLPLRLSRREPSCIWWGATDLWVRYQPKS